MIEVADVTAGAEGARAGTIEHDGDDVGITHPLFQAWPKLLDHGQRQGIEGGGGVEGGAAHPPVAGGCQLFENDDAVFAHECGSGNGCGMWLSGMPAQCRGTLY